MNFPGLYLKGKKGIYQIRLRVPEDIREAFGKIEHTESLKTSDEAKAKELYHQRLAKIHAEFNELRNPTDIQITSKSAKDHYEGILEEDFDYLVRVFEEANADQKAFWAGVKPHTYGPILKRVSGTGGRMLDEAGYRLYCLSPLSMTV